MINNYKKIIFIGFTGLLLMSCNMIDNQQSESIKTKLEDVKITNNIRTYRNCVEDGKNFDKIAVNKNEEAESLYNKSAKILSDCDFLIRSNYYMIDEVERMQNVALSIQNYIKAGNLIQASLNLKDYKDTFEKDLIYRDGSSFIENVESILNHNTPSISGKFALTNNNRVVRSELKRINYWSKN
jgi:hypothetical protein